MQYFPKCEIACSLKSETGAFLLCSQPTVGAFHTKGWTKFFSVQIFTFLGPTNDFHGPKRLRHFSNKIRTGQNVGKIQATWLISYHVKEIRIKYWYEITI
jgi:hypothetical protein